jgi:hypothetical protein
MDRCKHGMPIYEGKNGEQLVTCTSCNKEYQLELKKRALFRRTLSGRLVDEPTIEYLRSNSVIRASVPDWAWDDFCERFRAIKGYTPEYGTYICRHSAQDKETKHWFDLSISFPPAENLMFHNDLNVNEVSGNNLIYSNQLVWWLLELGLNFGKNRG